MSFGARGSNSGCLLTLLLSAELGWIKRHKENCCVPVRFAWWSVGSLWAIGGLISQRSPKSETCNSAFRVEGPNKRVLHLAFVGWKGAIGHLLPAGRFKLPPILPPQVIRVVTPLRVVDHAQASPGFTFGIACGMHAVRARPFTTTAIGGLGCKCKETLFLFFTLLFLRWLHPLFRKIILNDPVAETPRSAVGF